MSGEDWADGFFHKLQEEATVPAKNFVATLAGNVDNPNLTDADFRDLVRNTLPIVDYDRK